jgi:8-oxo-dGTP pyrophosphatase MutT (NUDIX family)/phosphohistidine phosphatase SixA
MPTRDVLAAGAVVFRPGRQVLLVHRPKYDDWSFPKGKLDPGEHPATAAVREVVEETGLRVRLGVPLPGQYYEVAAGTKHVSYWVARVLGDDDVRGYTVNDEIDEVAWLPYQDALVRLTYARDRRTLVEARPLRHRTHAVLVLRHAHARARKTWSKDDRRRPLVAEGREQAAALVPVLAAYAPTRVVTSGSTRCVDTVRPFAEAARVDLLRDDGLSQEDATPETVGPVVAALLTGDTDAVLCSHRPVLPMVLESLGVAPQVALAPGELVVAHVRRGVVVATERHRPG